LKDELVKELGADASKFRVFSWGIEQNVFKRNYEEEILELRKDLKIDREAPVIISARNLSPYYRVQNILEAVKKVIVRYSNGTFIFLRGYGTPEFENEMKEKATELGIEPNVRFISKVLRPREMALYLNLADIMVSLSKTDQLSAVLLESMACDAFPVLSKIDVYKTYITHEKNGLFVNGDDIDEIADAVIHCIEHPVLIQNGYKLNKEIIKKNEDWEVLKKEMIELYEILLALSLSN
jgi:glycosyltransferase involved in cell wall biosynthesis